MRLLRALAGAALTPTVLWLIVRSARGDVVNNPHIIGGVVTFVLPVTMMWLAVTVAPLTWWCVWSGRTAVAFGALVGAASGLVTTLLLYALLASDRPFPPDAGEIVNVLVIAPAIGALTSVVYWYLLDPTTYYRDRQRSAR